MKNIYFACVLIIMNISLFSQQWISYLPQNKVQNQELTFFEIQDAFNQWCSDNQVVNGYIEKNGVKTKVPYWKQFKRWEWYWADRVDPQTGEFPKTTASDVFEKYLKNYGDNKSQSGNWTNLGTSSSAGGYHGIGRLNCIGFRPGSSNIFYVGSPSGGLWKTANGGSTWIVLTDNNTVLGVSDIVVVPTVNQDILYIATGDKDGGSGWSMGGGQSHDNNSIGVLKSTDGGATWNTTGLSWSASQKRTISRLILDPNSSNNTLYAATSVGIYKTTNAGTNWTLQVSGPFIDMEINPGNSNTLYASTKDYWNSPKIYTTTNGGTSWSASKTFASTDYRVDLAVTAANTSYVYGIVANRNGGLTSIEQSTNSGSSFSSVYTAGASGTWLLGYFCDGSNGTSGNSGQGGYDLCIAADPTSASTVFIGGVNTWKSTDGGSSWSINNMWTSSGTYNSCGAPVVHADQHFLAFQNGTSTLFECNDGGVYKTTNGGASWTDLTNGMAISQIYRIGNAQTSATEVINGLQDNGTKNYASGTWSDVLGGDGMECFVDYTNVNNQYGEYPTGDIRRTTNHWASATNITGGLSGTGDWVTPFIIDPSVPNTIYVGYQDVFKSTNQGTSWTKISTWAGNKLKSLAVAPSNSNYICAATSSTTTTSAAIYRTINGGASWTNITGTLPTGSADITYVSIHATNPNIIWVSMGGYNSYGVYESTDGGSTWTNISTGLPSLPIMCVIQNKQNTLQNELYAGTDVGVYVKSGSTMWVPFMTGLPNVFVPELEIYYDNTNPGNSKLRAATFGRGLWESDLLTFPATWNGTVSNNWNTAANWTPAVVPSGATDVTIPATAPLWPTYTGNFSLGSQCKDLTMSGPSELTITGNLTSPSGFTLTNNANSTIRVSGDWNNTGGTFIPGMGQVDFNLGTSSTINSSVTNSANLTTTFASGVGQMANYFDITASGTNNLTINSFGINCNTTGSVSVEIWYVPVSYVGNQNIPTAWTQLGSTQTVTGMGIGNATPVNPGASLMIPSGTSYGFYISCYSGATAYLVFTSGNNSYSNSDMTVNCGEYGWTQQPGNGGGAGYSVNTTVYYTYNSSLPLSFWDVVVSKSNAVLTVADNLTVNNNLTIYPGAWLTNSTGKTLSIGNNFVMEASPAGTASYIDNGTTNVTGITTVQQYLTADVWHLVSSPVAGSTIAPYNDVYLSSYKEATGSWTGLVNTSLPMHTATGYAAQATTGYTGPTTISFTGSLQKSDYYIDTLSYTSSQTYSGFSLLGNPYPSSLDWNNSWPMTAFSGWMEVWDNGTYRGWHTSGTAYNGKTDGIIPSGQGFWVRTSNATNNITIPAAQRVHSAQGFYKQASDFEFPIIRLQSTINGYTDETGVIFHPESTTGFDSYFDLTKFTNVEDAPQLYSITGGANYAMNFYGENYLGEVIPIGFSTASSGVYTISASEIMNFDEDTFVWLEDLKTGEFSQLFEGMEYTFAYETIDDPHRFNLHFTNTTLGIDGITTNPIRIWSFKHVLYVENPSVERTHAEVFDILGKKIFDSSDIYSGVNQINLNVLPGYYLVKITSGENTQTAKVLLK